MKFVSSPVVMLLVIACTVPGPCHDTNSEDPVCITASEGGTGFSSGGLLELACETSELPPAVADIPYSHTFVAHGGVPPYQWSVDSLPEGLSLNPETGEIVGVPVVTGDGSQQVTVTVVDSSSADSSCDFQFPYNLGLRIDVSAMEDGGHCLNGGESTHIDELVADGVVLGGDGTPLTCKFDEAESMFFPPGTGLRGHGNLPLGISVSEFCEVSGEVDPSERFGVYGFIMTVTQEGSGQKVYLPFCVPQVIPGAYGVSVKHMGSDWDLEPGITQMDGSSISFGDASPSPEVTVENLCTHNRCYYKFFFGLNTLSGGAVGASPHSALPGGAGFTHALRISETELPASLTGRYWVVNTSFDYCLFGTDTPDVDSADAENEAVCGTSELAQENGGGNLEFSLVVVPE